MNLRSADTRGVMRKSWITSLRTFSNNDYWNPRYMNWHCVKVINDDTQQPGGKVPRHEHRNYDIFGYVVEGELEHTDSLGNTVTARAGQIQHMWCGKGIHHTEACVGSTPARYLQLWFTPNRDIDTAPYYELYEKGPEFDEIKIPIKCDLTVSGGILSSPRITNNSYLYVVSGSCTVEGVTLSEGDGAEIDSVSEIVPTNNPHILLFELN
jgi:redox-sensitive bicupin YhaK (pirin superfamily)